MRNFPLTHKKFLSLSSHGRRKWIIKWLTEQYQHLVTNRAAQNDLEELYTIHSRIHLWINEPIQPKPDTSDMRIWMAFLSDAIHIHRTALGIMPKDHDLLPPIVNIGDLTDTVTHDKPLDYHLALDGLRSLFNVGSIIRTCDAGGFSSVILGNTPGAEHRIVQKTSMGAADWVPQSRTTDLGSALLEKKEQGYPVIGIETASSAVPFHQFSWPSKGIIVFGNEEYGLSAHVLSICDHLVTLPMAGRKNSINVAGAAAVIVFHVATCLRP